MLPILGDMHYLIAFVGTIGNQTGSLRETVLHSSTFRSIESMQGISENIRALRISVQVLQRFMCARNTVLCQ